MANPNSTGGLPPDLFAATRWSVVLTASDSSLGSQCHQALSELCQSYWFPVFAYLRRKGYSKSEAEDLTQSFFARLLEKKSYAEADPERGRFRAFLIASLKHFLCNIHKRKSAQKRGGGIQPIQLDADDGDGRYQLADRRNETPEVTFDREWAHAVIDTTLNRLRQEYVQESGDLLFDQLANGLTHPEQVLSQAALAEKLGMTEAAVKSSLQRLRKRYRWILRQEIAQTTAHADEINSEIHHLIACLKQPEFKS